jgi:MOSC domain-containing protein YiiM
MQVMVYQIDSYRYWERILGRSDFTFGQFSENFTVEGVPDDQVCIGDRYSVPCDAHDRVYLGLKKEALKWS